MTGKPPTGLTWPLRNLLYWFLRRFYSEEEARAKLLAIEAIVAGS